MLDGDELGRQQDVEGGDAGQHQHQVQRGVHDVLGGDHAEGGPHHDRSDQVERDVLGDHELGEHQLALIGRRPARGMVVRCSVSSGLLDLLLGPGLVGLDAGHGLHPLAQPALVVQQLGDVGLGVLVLGAPEQGLERAHLDADAAVHAEREVDVEAIEGVLLAGLAALTTGRGQVLVGLDVDAPVGALVGAEHARGAVLLVQGDHATGPGRGSSLTWG